MAKPISNDLRVRVCAVIAEGMSCRQAAAQFKVSASSAIRWQARLRDAGSPKPDALGGDHRSDRIETQADFILAEVAARSDITLHELRTQLQARGESFGIGTLWRFFHRRKITLKKRRCMPLSSSVQM
jgi:transposase